MCERINGLCDQMCPDEEIQLREKERLLHVLEMVPGTEAHVYPTADREKIVKSYSRSAAGKDMHHPKNLRTPETLLKTVNYLLLEVVDNKTLPWYITYDFIADRLLAIRQDIVIQRLSPSYSISLLQPIVRFYAYSAYRLCELPVAKFDPFTNERHLQECLKRLLVLYDECDAFEEKCATLNNRINFDEYNYLYADNRPHIEAIYLLFNLGNSTAITRGLSLPQRWRTGILNEALKTSLCAMKQNWVRTCRLIVELPPILAGVASLHLPAIRRQALQTMSVAYSSQRLTFPVDVLRPLLLYSKDVDVINDCEYYKIRCKGDEISFLRSDFDSSIKTAPTRQEDWVKKKLRGVTIPALVLYGQL